MDTFEIYITTLLAIGFAGLCIITALALTRPDYFEDREDY